MTKLTIKDMIGLEPKYANFVIEYAKDFDARRAATASGFEADSGYKIRDREDVQQAIDRILHHRLESSHIDAEWALWEAVDNHRIARQMGNITASNTALGLIMKHAKVDAFAVEKIQVAGDKEIMERLLRARKRREPPPEEDEEVSFL